jgi:hypothetical protein
LAGGNALNSRVQARTRRTYLSVAGKGFVGLAFDTTPGCVDTQPFPTAPVKWSYQAIYRLGDSRVGQWSKPVSVTVGG